MKKNTPKKQPRKLSSPIAGAYIEGSGIVEQKDIVSTLEENYMPYAMSVIVSRALPEIDGFKPSHRKLLYTMYKMGLLTGNRTKSANIVGQTMRLNPHGDAAIYDTMVRMGRGNESLLMQHLLKTTTDKKRRAYLINYFLEQFRTTLYRQTMFAEFELMINEKVENGESLTAEALCDMYRKLNLLYYGEDIVIDHELDMEWARIPHFYYNYYVYQYATGFSAAIALSQRILKEGESAVKDYIGFLSGGCSKDPISLLRGAGVDMTSKKPVTEALKLFGELIDEMEDLMQ